MALRYLLIMENFPLFCPGAYVNFTCDFDKRPVYKLIRTGLEVEPTSDKV